MTVQAVLSRKGNDVATIAPTAVLSKAIGVLAERRIGALVVTGPDHRVIGIVSERDIVRILAERGADALSSPVADIMTRKVVTCGPHDTVRDIMERMTSGKFRHVPVIDQGRLAGIISIGDVVKSRVEDLVHEHAALEDYIRTA